MVDVLLVVVILVAVAVSLFVGYLVGRALTTKAKELETLARVEDASEESVKLSRSVLTGKFIEQLAPFLPDFRYDPTEVRFIGSPVDCLVFCGATLAFRLRFSRVNIKETTRATTETEDTTTT